MIVADRDMRSSDMLRALFWQMSMNKISWVLQLRNVVDCVYKSSCIFLRESIRPHEGSRTIFERNQRLEMLCRDGRISLISFLIGIATSVSTSILVLHYFGLDLHGIKNCAIVFGAASAVYIILCVCALVFLAKNDFEVKWNLNTINIHNSDRHLFILFRSTDCCRLSNEPPYLDCALVYQRRQSFSHRTNGNDLAFISFSWLYSISPSIWRLHGQIHDRSAPTRSCWPIRWHTYWRQLPVGSNSALKCTSGLGSNWIRCHLWLVSSFVQRVKFCVNRLSSRRTPISITSFNSAKSKGTHW